MPNVETGSSSLRSSSEESASEEEGRTPDNHQMLTACRHFLTDLGRKKKDLRKKHHDLQMKVISSSILIKTNDHKIEHLKDDKKKLEQACKTLNENIKLMNGINKIENQRGFLEEQCGESKKKITVLEKSRRSTD